MSNVCPGDFMNRFIMCLACCLLLNDAIADVRTSPIDRQDTVKVNAFNALSAENQWYDFNQSLAYAKQALALAERLAFTKGIAVANYRIAHCYWAFGDSDLAIAKGLEAMSIAEKENMQLVLAEVYRILARCYADQKENHKAVQFINKAENIGRKFNDWDLLSRVYNLAGVIHLYNNQPDTALQLYSRALQIVKEHNTQKAQLSHILSNIGSCYRENNPTLALQYYALALQSAKNNSNRSAEAGITADIGNAYAQKGMYREADQSLHESLRLARKLGLKRIVRFSYASLVNLKLLEGKTGDALEYLQNYNDVNDSLLNVAKTRAIVTLEARHEAEKKEQQIALLEQEKRNQTGLIIGTVLMVIALSVIHKLQRSRTKETKELLTAQQELNKKLKEADRLKSRFFANISHEFRTPLSLILGPIENKLATIQQGSPEQQELQVIQRNANRLLELVNQLLDLSRLEANKMELNIKEGDLASLLQVLSASFNSLAESRQIKFKTFFNITDTKHLFDADKLEKIISNVLFNAFKFTPPGGVVLLSANTARDNNLIIKVSDTGKGIPVEEQEHIFSPFYQSKYTLDNGQPGTGLGLSLVNELTKLYQGKIDLYSEPGKGTLITISLPLSREEWIIGPAASSHARRSSIRISQDLVTADHAVAQGDHPDSDSILIIEDNADLRNFIATILNDRFNIYTAINGDDGLALAFEKVPNLVISDVMMPQMDGIELTDKLKNDERTSHIPVILLTAKADAYSRMSGFQKGADDYLTKPFSTQELQVRVSNLIEQRKKLAIRFKERLAQATQEPKEPSLDDKFIQRATGIVEANLSNYNFSVEKFAEEMNLSRAQLFRKFKALTDSAPSEFINEIRLQRAARMIRAKSDTLAQISYAVGFNQQSYFTKRFKKKFGVLPGEYGSTDTSQPSASPARGL